MLCLWFIRLSVAVFRIHGFWISALPGLDEVVSGLRGLVQIYTTLHNIAMAFGWTWPLLIFSQWQVSQFEYVDALVFSSQSHGLFLGVGCPPKSGENPRNPGLFKAPLKRQELQLSCQFFRTPHLHHHHYPLVNIQKAIENGHRNSGFSQTMVIFQFAMLNYQRVYAGETHDGWMDGLDG